MHDNCTYYFREIALAPTLKISASISVRMTTIPGPMALQHLDICYQEQMQSILSTIEAGVQLWNAEGRLVYANPASVQQFGYPLAEVGGHWSDWAGSCKAEADESGGAVEFPLAMVLGGKAQFAQSLVRLERPDGVRRWIRFNVHALGDRVSAGFGGAVSSTVDVTAMHDQEHLLIRQAHYDALTGLPNRVLLSDRLNQALARSERNGEMLAVCMLDLDGFKAVNDTLGHKAGDQLLQEIGHRLLEAIRREDTAARIGGDEFALLLGSLKTAGQCEQILKRVLDSVAAPCLLGCEEARVSASVGVVYFPGDAADADQLLRHADQAMYKAKQAGKNRFCIFDPAAESRARANLGLLNKLERALARNEFCLYYQPKVDCRLGRVVGLEALIRWQHPVLGLRAPGEFLPLIEQEDIIIRLGEWVITEAMRELDRLGRAGFDLTISVNVPARQFLRGNFERRLDELLRQHDPELASRLEIEIVETAALEDISLVSSLLGEYHKRGVKFALDDFGTGFSSLVHLKRLAADVLKIDQTFIRDMLIDPGDLAIVQGVIGLATAFQRQVVAEGVETIEHVLMLLDLGCDVMQGYVIARPMPGERLLSWLQNFKADPRWLAAHSGYPTHSHFDLLLMEVTHQRWLEEIKAEGLQPLPPDIGLADHSQCRLSGWLANPEIQSAFGRLEAFRNLEVEHREVHRVAAEFLRRHPGRREERGGVGVSELEAAHVRFLARLREFRVAEMRRKNVVA